MLHTTSYIKCLIGNSFICLRDNDPELIGSTVKAYLTRKTCNGTLSVRNWPPQSPELCRVGSSWLLEQKAGTIQRRYLNVHQEVWRSVSEDYFRNSKKLPQRVRAKNNGGNNDFHELPNSFSIYVCTCFNKSLYPFPLSLQNINEGWLMTFSQHCGRSHFLLQTKSCIFLPLASLKCMCNVTVGSLTVAGFLQLYNRSNKGQWSVESALNELCRYQTCGHKIWNRIRLFFHTWLENFG